MKIYILLTAFFILQLTTTGCPLCTKKQPKILSGILHGTGPQDNLDYAIAWTAVAVVLVTLFFSVKWLVKPGEKDESHIKRFILNEA